MLKMHSMKLVFVGVVEHGVLCFVVVLGNFLIELVEQFTLFVLDAIFWVLYLGQIAVDGLLDLRVTRNTLVEETVLG